jgi:hypothetical protein
MMKLFPKSWLPLWLLVGMVARVEASPAIEVDFGKQARYELRQRLQPGEHLEVCAKLVRGTELRSSFRAGAPLDFNVHHHLGTEVVYAVEKTGLSSYQHRLHAGLDQHYCWMWSNKGAEPVELALKLGRG